MDSLIKVDCKKKSIKDYEGISPMEVELINKKAKDLKGLKITHINATSLGGGVAEMLRSIVPLQQDIGLESEWLIIPPDQEFFSVTKEIHNLLQGKPGKLSKKQKNIYLNYNLRISKLISRIKTDILMIHDPQPAASLSFSSFKNKTIWRCHVDTTEPNENALSFLSPFLEIYDNTIFSSHDFIPENFSKNKVAIITPVIDPLAVKNLPISKGNARKYIQKLGINTNKPLITQISRLDPWKDQIGVIDSYRLAKKIVPNLQLALVAQFASDDPEGEIIFKEVKKYMRKEEGIFLFVNLSKNDFAVRAFQIASDIIMQKSIREGFGLTITEAMWKKKVVIAGNVGGIKNQIQNGVNGFLVDSPLEAAEKIIYALENQEIVSKISENAHLTVKNKFLLPHKILNYLNVFKEILDTKSFQINPLY